MNFLDKYAKVIDTILYNKGYPAHKWEELDGLSFQDDAFIQAAIVVRDEVLKLSEDI